MTISTTVYVEHADLGLAPTIRSLEDARIRVLPEASTDPTQEGYWFWITASDFDAVERTLSADHTVAAFSRLWGSGRRQTYRIRYSERAKLISPAILERDGLMLESKSEREGWLVRLQFPDHGRLYDLYEYATDEGLSVDVREVYQDAFERHRELELTESQVEALMAAYEHGYYDEPREISLEELGALLGISPTAVGGRLRRASARLVEQCLDENVPH